MRIPRAAVPVACAGALLAACAPDAWKRDPATESFYGQVEKACYYQRIGTVNVGDLLNRPGSREGDYFLDMLSRLHAGKVPPDAWTSSVTSFLVGRPSDPGVKCVLDQYAKAKGTPK
jgi:hypothetical protein